MINSKEVLNITHFNNWVRKLIPLHREENRAQKRVRKSEEWLHTPYIYPSPPPVDISVAVHQNSLCKLEAYCYCCLC